VLGRSLRSSRHERVLLHTEDVPPEMLALLSEDFQLRRVEPLATEPSRVFEGSRHLSRVFLKLRTLELEEFEKVLFLDADLLVRRPLDELFGLQAPAGVEVNAAWDAETVTPMGQRVDPARLVDPNTGALCSRINAGVLLLRPDRQTFDALLREAAQPGPDGASCNPEEDLLTRFFAKEWTSLGLRNNLELWRWYAVAPEDVQEAAVFHFSGREHKPLRYWLWTEDDFTEGSVEWAKYRWGFPEARRSWLWLLAAAQFEWAEAALRDERLHPFLAGLGRCPCGEAMERWGSDTNVGWWCNGCGNEAAQWYVCHACLEACAARGW